MSDPSHVSRTPSCRTKSYPPSSILVGLFDDPSAEGRTSKNLTPTLRGPTPAVYSHRDAHPGPVGPETKLFY